MNDKLLHELYLLEEMWLDNRDDISMSVVIPDEEDKYVHYSKAGVGFTTKKKEIVMWRRSLSKALGIPEQRYVSTCAKEQDIFSTLESLVEIKRWVLHYIKTGCIVEKLYDGQIRTRKDCSHSYYNGKTIQEAIGKFTNE